MRIRTTEGSRFGYSLLIRVIDVFDHGNIVIELIIVDSHPTTN